MALIRNTLVFLDTGFFKHHKPMDNAYKDFLQYSKDEKIVLCTSYMCLKEWHSQKVEQIIGFIKSSQENYSQTRRSNIVADGILSKYPGHYPDIEEIKKDSVQIIEEFIEDHGIRIYHPKEDHFDRVFGAYFNGEAPYRDRKAKEDIPDSWIFEAAKDARFDNDNEKLENKFCIGTDKDFNEHLEGLGLKPIKKFDLIEQLRREEDELASGTQETTKALADTVHVAEGVEIDSDLEGLLNSAINPESREIYIRILGYTHWLSGPSKQDLFSIIEERGFNRQLIEAVATMLSQDSLELIEDTGNHFLPKNHVVCKEAANLIMEEAIEILGQ